MMIGEDDCSWCPDIAFGQQLLDTAAGGHVVAEISGDRDKKRRVLSIYHTAPVLAVVYHGVVAS